MKAALLVLVCFVAASDHNLGAAKAAAPAKASHQRCPTEKIQFTRETGCHNDCYLQFCLPAEDKKLRAAVRRIAPTAHNRGGQTCGTETELLFFLRVEVATGSCVERWGPMTTKAWNQVCALARLPQIHSLRHTIYE